MNMVLENRAIMNAITIEVLAAAPARFAFCSPRRFPILPVRGELAFDTLAI